MKLLTKYNRVNILATIIVFMIGGLCYYFMLHFILVKQLDRDLKVEEQEIADYIKANKSLPDSTNYGDQKISFEQTDLPAARKINSVDILNATEGEYITSRQLVFPISISGKNYKVSVSKSQQETEDLIKLIVTLTLSMLVLLLLILFIINRFVLNKLWHPFNNTLTALKHFNINSKSVIRVDRSNINEFNELNDAVTTMSNRVLNDYEALKNFTENASHEIQTPLAVVNSKLELLMQSENFSEAQMNDIEIMHDEVRRLSKLNQSLLLLTKIDNQQFIETREVDIAAIINKHLTNYEELIAAKQIMLTKSIDATSEVLMNETLAVVLLSNLITNAIKHNFEQGSIEIILHKKKLTIKNTGTALNCIPDALFERFKKNNPESESLGLGLSFVKKICEQYGFSISYNFSSGIHSISIQFT